MKTSAPSSQKKHKGPPQLINGTLPALVGKPTEDVTIVHQVLQKLNMEAKPKRTFLDFPAEIRNKIYTWTYILSRTSDDIYNRPDLEVHGDRPYGGIRWLNIPRFNLLLVDRKVYHEVIAIISSQMFLEIKTYRLGDTRALDCVTGLNRASSFCINAKRVGINLTPGSGKWASQMRGIAAVLSRFPKLESLDLRIMVHGLTSIGMWMAKPVFEIARRNRASLCVELIDVMPKQRYRAAKRSQWLELENSVYELAEEAIGDSPEVSLSCILRHCCRLYLCCLIVSNTLIHLTI